MKLFTWEEKDETAQRLKNLLKNQNKFSFTENKIKSFNADIAKNLYIESDNLYALLFLQKDYKEKIKIIYIDPPYNTGKKFTYADNFQSKAEWMNYLYIRLSLAKTLLSNDGLIFISIDDKAYPYLRIILDEIFGMENFISTLVWNNSTGGGLRKKHINTSHEYIVLYAKDKTKVKPMTAPMPEKAKKMYKYKDDDGRFFRYQQFAWKNKTQAKNQRYPIKTPDGNFIIPKDGYIYRFVEKTFLNLLEKNLIVFKKTDKSVFKEINGNPTRWTVWVKTYLKKEEKTVPKSLLPTEYVKTNIQSAYEQKVLFGAKVFDYAKPVTLLKYLFKLVPDSEDAIILDFFSGSAATAQAVMELNAEFNETRKFILVQRDEPCPEDSPALKAGFKTIAELGRERIIRASALIQKRFPEKTFGFKYLELSGENGPTF
ncbi:MULTISPECIES: site-specific DNA-methyltransferase [unclassified Treponema]|uniref:site-specific DNA-methyltransferase n=1 Tax=unclassified Treponema TaxID=2638727 RepID=UPI0020A25807|nr:MULTISPECIES: site-specific DNA-methyltransferase [unclassified Treponema]UTC66628.1 site-specific DNA-methyltransferase [Treponema sp. OMZ 789]UTC69360.1 site-specific DNA-methyltransferase [Treponema sp. OMZ 790]UTC72075.1 site-specific DNA-methyltransferase [Treponema sp. OMZ 791]